MTSDVTGFLYLNRANAFLRAIKVEMDLCCL